MKKILIIFCFILVVYAIWFPLTYFKSNMDKKEVRISQILVDKESTAREVQEELAIGKDFKSMVKKYSIDDLVFGDDGDLGYAHKGRFDERITNAAYSLNKDEISAPIKTDYGFHIIKVTEINYFSEPQNFKYNPFKFIKEDKEGKDKKNI